MEKLKILHMYPNMLDLYGDSGNVEVLSYRCKMRGIELEVSKHLIGDKETDFTQYDIIYLAAVLTLNSRYLPMTLFPARTVSLKLIRQEHFS